MYNVKNLIKKIPGFEILYRFKKNYKYHFDFYRDKKFFQRNYMYSRPITKEKLEYDMLFEIHKLEKGFATTKNQRPFGIDKIKRIIKDIKEYEKFKFAPSFAYNLAYSSLESYIKFYEEKKWTDKEEYKLVLQFINQGCKHTHIPVGAFDYHKSDFISDALIDYDKFISSRRSIRNFSNKKLAKKDIIKAVNMAIKTPTACNRQMCKIYYASSDKSRETIEKYAQGIGLFDLLNVNYFVITFDISANYFIGERNQGWFNSGLITMNFVNALHSLGIGSCCIQFGNSFEEEKELKKTLNISPSERVGVIITAGYYDEISRIPYSSRKPIEEIYREI